MLGAEKVLAPELEERCGGDSSKLEARRIAAASRRRLLKCIVCGATVKKVFGTRKRWHFALFPGGTPCDHENETLEHRESKLALFRALQQSLPRGWTMLLEERLTTGRRPDVLAIHESGAKVAFEVQYADLSAQDWRERHEDYVMLGIRDVWLLGHVREGRRRDALADVLAQAEGQRIAYIGRRAGEQEVKIKEAVFSERSSRGIPYKRPGSFSSDAPVAEWVEYGPARIRLLNDGAPRTPADTAYDSAKKRHERELRELEYRRRADDERRRREKERQAQSAAEAESRRRWAKERRAEEAHAWQESPERAEARRQLGDRVLDAIEEECPFDRNIYCPPGRWKVGLYLSRVHGRPPGTVFDWFKAAGAVLRVHRHNKRQNGKWAWEALNGFSDQLARGGLLEFDHHDDRGMARYWRTPLSKEQRNRLIEERAREDRRREERERRSAERQRDFEKKWERNRKERESREQRERERASSARNSAPLASAGYRLSQEERLFRAERFDRWLFSDAREEARVELGRPLLNRLERDEDLDRAILVHPGEWKVWLFRTYVHGKTSGGVLDLEETTREVLKSFPTVGAAPLGNEAVRQFVLFLLNEGFVEQKEESTNSSTDELRRYLVIGTAQNWLHRLQDKVERLRGKSEW